MSIRSKIKKNLFAIISIGLALVVMTGFLLSNDGLARFGEIMQNLQVHWFALALCATDGHLAAGRLRAGNILPAGR